MKHGPIALIDPEFPSFVIATEDELFNKVISNIKEIQARKGPIICLTHPGFEVFADHVWEIPNLGDVLTSFLILPALQLFAYEMVYTLVKMWINLEILQKALLWNRYGYEKIFFCYFFLILYFTSTYISYASTCRTLFFKGIQKFLLLKKKTERDLNIDPNGLE